MDEGNSGKLLELTADVVAAHVSNNSVAVAEIAGLVRAVYGALAAPLGADVAEPVAERQPAVAVRSSVKREYLVCLECGKKHKTLRRHLQTAHGLEPGEYRDRWKLPKDYPLVSAEYSERRAGMARAFGLGRSGRGGVKSAASAKLGKTVRRK